MPFKVAVIGAGWYGCHIASSLASLGFQIMVFDRAHRPLHEASGNNQFRLHLGFHYARHQGTRQQSRDGFLRFIERYPTLSGPIEENVYAVPNEDSLIDFQTYKLIMASSGIDFIELKQHERISDIEGALSTSERVLLISRARTYFTQRLGSTLNLGTEIRSIVSHPNHVEVEGIKFDYVIDATWGKFAPLPLKVYYEPTLLLYYDVKVRQPAVTFVDGPLSSVYPTEDPSIYTLSSVPHTPIGSFSSANEAMLAMQNVNGQLIATKRAAMETQISKNIPQFLDNFSFAGVQISMKTKPVGRTDDRSCYVYQNGRTISVMSGKIDTIFFATERILSLLEAQNSEGIVPTENTIRDDILTTKQVAGRSS